MGERFLIDTSGVIKYIDKTFPPSAISFLDIELDKEINLSIVTKVEVLGWNPPDPNDIQRFKIFTEIASIYLITEEIGDIAVLIRKLTKVKLPDVFIAATAIANKFTLLADNDKDFNKIVALGIGLRYLNPFTIK